MNSLPIGTKIQSPTTTYTITGILGSGGFGITYSATCSKIMDNCRVKVIVALKEHFVKADCQRESETKAVTCSAPARERVERSMRDFMGEARRLNQISGKNPYIVTVSEVFEANNTAYYAMEMLEGVSLKDYVDAHGPMNEWSMLPIMLPIIDAVAFLHKNRITHLDIKPQNIMLSTDGDDRQRPVLIDFGLSKHYDDEGNATSTINTQGYSDGYAPMEQYIGISNFSPESDVYSLAATMFFCLTGRRLPAANDLYPEVLEKELPKDISPELREILKSALSQRKSHRPKDASVLRSLFRYFDQSTVRTSPKLWDEENATKIIGDKPAPAKIVKDSKPKDPEISEVKIEPVRKKRRWLIPAIVISAVVILGGAIGWLMLTKNGGGNAGEAADSTLLLPMYSNGKWNYADTDGNIILTLKDDYDLVGSFSDNIAVVKKDGKFGFIDKAGEVVIPVQYDGAFSFQEGLALVYKDNKVGFIDETGKIVIPLQYDRINSFSEGLALVWKDNKFGFIDKTGKIVIPLQYEIAESFSDGLALVYKDNKAYFIDKTGKIVNPLQYDWADSFSEGLALVRKDNKMSFVDKTGKIVIPLPYDFGLSFSEGLAVVGKDNKWGYIDKTGKVVVPLQYDAAWPFSEGLASVSKDNKWGYIDKTGKVVIPLQYDEALPFSVGLAQVKKDGKVVFIDHFGNFKPDKKSPPIDRNRSRKARP